MLFFVRLMFIQSTSRDSSEVANGPIDLGYDEDDYDDEDGDDDSADDDDEADQRAQKAVKEELERREQAARQAKQLLKRSRPVYEEYMPTSPAPSYSDSEVSIRDQGNVGESEPEDSDAETKKLRLLIQHELEQRVKGKKQDKANPPSAATASKKKKSSKEFLKEVAAGRVESRQKPIGQAGLNGKQKKQLASCLKQCQQLATRIQNLANENA